jgi:hypothetical protein
MQLEAVGDKVQVGGLSFILFQFLQYCPADYFCK